MLIKAVTNTMEKMVNFEGTYQLIENINAVEILKVLGVESDKSKLECLTTIRSTINFKMDGDTCIVEAKVGDTPRTVAFPLGVEVEENMLGATLRSIASIEGNKFVIRSTDGRKSGGRVYEFTETGCEMTLINNTSIKRIFKKL